MKPVAHTINLTIGRQSSGEHHIVNLTSLPNIFISHSLDSQLPNIFISFIEQIVQEQTGYILALSLSSRMAQQIVPVVPAGFAFISFLHDAAADGKINSIDTFMKALMAELKKRKAFYKGPVVKEGMPPMLVIMDDIFEVIMSANKKTAVIFIELLITAPALGMYFIVGSSGIYRNLLDQLIYISPALKKKLDKSVQEYTISQPLGAELVMNPDGLIFYRERGEKIHKRLYPLVAGEDR